MELSEKLVQLRKNNNLTQEQLASKLFVSRTAISKWESGRGYPSIDSLKQLSEFFNISVDELLDANELIVIAEKSQKDKTNFIFNLFYGIVDILTLLLFFLPVYGVKNKDIIINVSLLNLKNYISVYIFIFYIIFTTIPFIFGVLLLSLQNLKNIKWLKYKLILSLLFSGICLAFNILAAQPYSSLFLLSLITFKTLLIIKNK